MTMSYKSFVDEVEKRLNAMTAGELRQLILYWAEQKKPERRRFFLDQLKEPSEDKTSFDDDQSVIVAVREFCTRISDGDYLDEDEWQDDEFDGVAGDESWVEEMDCFLAKARQRMLNRQYQTAQQIYEPILAVLEKDWELNLLPGSSDVVSMLNENLPEHVALFFHAVYRTNELNERPRRLYQAITRFKQMSRFFYLTSINEVLKDPLPGLDAFLPKWIRYLLDHPSSNSSRLIRDAFKPQDEAVMADFAHQYANRYPGVYVDLLDRILKRDATAEAAIVARKALQAIDPELCVRAQTGDRLALIGKQQNNITMQLEGCSAAFFSSPGLSRLLSLYEAAWQNGDFADVSRQAVERLQALLDQPEKPYRTDDDEDLKQARADEQLLIHALLLNGCYPDAIEAAQTYQSLGWTYGTNPKPAMFYFFVAVLTPRDRQQPFITEQWQTIVDQAGSRLESIDFALYQEMSYRIIEHNPLDEQHKEILLTWLQKETTARIQAIVGNQYRTSYYKAAMLLAVLIQTHSILGRQQEGRDLISQIEARYSCYSAFRAEIRKASRLINYAPAKNT